MVRVVEKKFYRLIGEQLAVCTAKPEEKPAKNSATRPESGTVRHSW